MFQLSAEHTGTVDQVAPISGCSDVVNVVPGLHVPLPAVILLLSLGHRLPVNPELCLLSFFGRILGCTSPWPS